MNPLPKVDLKLQGSATRHFQKYEVPASPISSVCSHDSDASGKLAARCIPPCTQPLSQRCPASRLFQVAELKSSSHRPAPAHSS